MPVQLLTTPADLDAYAGALTELEAHASEPNVFFEGWFLRSALTHLLKPGSTVAIALISSPSGSPIGLIPLQWQERSLRAPFRRISVWQHRHCFLATPLLRASAEQESICELLTWLRTSYPRVPLLTLPGMCADGPVYKALQQTLISMRMPSIETVRIRRAFQSADLTPDQYFAKLSKHDRKELRRKERRVTELAPPAFRTLADPAELPHWCETFLSIEASGWKGRACSALRHTPEDRAFFCDLLAAALAKHKLLMTQLDIGARPAAANVVFVSGGGSFAFKIAYDEDFARLSPGTLAAFYTLESILRDKRSAWLDSGAEPDHPLLDRIFLGRRTIVTLEIGLHGARALRLLHSARRVYRRLFGSRHRTAQNLNHGSDPDGDGEASAASSRARST